MELNFFSSGSSSEMSDDEELEPRPRRQDSNWFQLNNLLSQDDSSTTPDGPISFGEETTGSENSFNDDFLGNYSDILLDVQGNKNETSTTDFDLIIGKSSYTIDMVFNDAHLLSIITYSCLFLFSATGNLTVLAVILRRRKQRSPFSRIDFMLLNLCIADLLVTFFMMPLEIAWSYTVSWKGGAFTCRFMAFFRIFGLYLSGFVLVCLAIDRYLAVKHPMQTLGSGRRGKIMISCAWGLSVLCSLPQSYIFHLASHPDHPTYVQCVTFGSLPGNYELAYRIFSFLMMYAVPFVLILFLYGGIILELYRVSRRVPDAQSQMSGGLRRSGLGNLGRAREKTLKMTIAIVGMYIVCWSPYYTIVLWYMIDEQSALLVDYRIQRALFLFASTNSTVNPIVYGIFHLKSTFRAETRMGYSRESLYRSTLTNQSSILVNGIHVNHAGQLQSVRLSRNPSVITARSFHKTSSLKLQELQPTNRLSSS